MSELNTPVSTLEAGLRAYLSQKSGLNAWWMRRADDDDNCFVYRRISPGVVAGNLQKTGIKADVFSITLYHDNADEALIIVNSIAEELNDFSGLLGGYPVQLVEPEGGFDRVLDDEEGATQYQFNRDFRIYY